MKLELKHLAPYLPYKMKFVIDMYEFTEGNCKPEIRHFTMGNDLSMCLNYGKPILRPLSDLTEEINVNGEKFIPLYKLIKEDKAFTTDFINAFGYEELKVSVYELLLEWCFDVFGLIEQGLAVDINTLSE